LMCLGFRRAGPGAARWCGGGQGGSAGCCMSGRGDKASAHLCELGGVEDRPHHLRGWAWEEGGRFLARSARRQAAGRGSARRTALGVRRGPQALGERPLCQQRSLPALPQTQPPPCATPCARAGISLSRPPFRMRPHLHRHHQGGALAPDAVGQRGDYNLGRRLLRLLCPARRPRVPARPGRRRRRRRRRRRQQPRRPRGGRRVAGAGAARGGARA
jgi:hypothetical protein